MESVNLMCHPDRTELILTGVLDVSCARDAYQTLNEALIRALPLEIDTGGLERLDTAALQLLVAFGRVARERGLQLHWSSVSQALRGSAELLGLAAALELPA